MKPAALKLATFILMIGLFGGLAVAAYDPSIPSMTLNVSGYPVSGERLKLLAEEEFSDSLKSEYGTAWLDLSSLNAPSVLGPGETTLLDANIKILKNNYVALKKIYVVAKNQALSRIDDAALIISNDPETVKEDRVLLKEELRAGSPIRVLYFHKAGEGKDFLLSVSISNPSPYPIDIFAAKGLGGPCEDEIYAGHTATERFMRQEKQSEGRIIRVLPNSSCLLAVQPLKSNSVSCGILRLRQLSGRSSLLRISATRVGSNTSDGTAFVKTKEDGRFSGRIGQAYVDINKDHKCGTGPLDIRIGEGPTFISENHGFDIHLGNYGLIHRISIKIENALAEDRRVSLYYAAAGGPTRAVLLVSGSLVETGLLDPKKNKSQEIASVFVPKKTSRSLFIKVMPQPGSFYPARLVLMDQKP